MKVTAPKSLVYLLCHALVFALGIILCTTGTVVLVAIGTSLIASGVVGWVVYAYVLTAERISERLDILQRFGFVNAFDGRQVRIKSYYDELLEKSSEQIDVMGFGLRALREDYLREFINWSRKAKVRILLIDPDFPTRDRSYARQRDHEENDHSGTIAQQVQQFISDTRDLRQSSHKDAFQIRLYKCLPSINIFRVDDMMFWGPYLVKEPSRNSPTLLVERGGLLFDHLADHFESIWTDESLSRPLRYEE